MIKGSVNQTNTKEQGRQSRLLVQRRCELQSNGGGGEFSKFADENWGDDTKDALRVVTVGSCPKRESKLFAHKS